MLGCLCNDSTEFHNLLFTDFSCYTCKLFIIYTMLLSFKDSTFRQLTGFSKPTSGTAYIEGLDIRLDMDRIYTGIGVCPQDE
jgi:ABC-type Na+ transport system ATPase subunit NatA